MKRLQAYQFRLEPKHKHLEHLVQSSGANRFVWNKLRKMNLYRLNNKLPLIWYNEMAWFITLWKKSEDYSFLKTAPSQSLQQTAKALDRAFRDAFDKKQPHKRLPVKKKLGKNEAGIHYPQHIVVDEHNQVIHFPKLGWVKYRNSRPLEGKVKNVTIQLKNGQYLVSIQTEREVEAPVHSSTSSIGIDMGIIRFATLSNGESIDPRNSFKQFAETLAHHQQKLARKVKFSANWVKQTARINRLHRHIAAIRRDFLHKSSNQISKNHAMIVIEDLKIRNMTKSSKGTIESPGSRVAQKSGLNRSILDQGWYEFRRQLTYKQEWRGGRLLAVPPHHTSQTCPRCRHVSAENRPSQAVFFCTACSYENHADTVAACNILTKGLATLANQQKPRDNAGFACQVNSLKAVSSRNQLSAMACH